MNNKNNDDLDDICKWIEDSSKVLTKKQKNKLDKKKTSNEADIKKEKKNRKQKIKKFNRTEDPFYKKTLSERIQLQKEYQKMIKDEKMFKDNKMQEIMNKVQKMSETDRNNYLNNLLQNNEIELK